MYNNEKIKTVTAVVMVALIVFQCFFAVIIYIWMDVYNALLRNMGYSTTYNRTWIIIVPWLLLTIAFESLMYYAVFVRKEEKSEEQVLNYTNYLEEKKEDISLLYEDDK